MRQLEKASVILELAKTMRKRGSWMGETHLQKSVYFLQQLLGVPLEFDFILYKHGPFSFDLRSFLTYMASEEFIAWQSQAPYGPSLNVGEMGETLLDQFGSKAALYEEKINFVADWLGTKNVSELERIGTALYVDDEEELTGSSRASRIMELKPHVDELQSQAAIKELDEMKAALRAAHIN
jgi:uncharacterized protein YwgA